MGDISNQDEPVLARIHSECLTGDALHSLNVIAVSSLQPHYVKLAKLVVVF